MINRLGLILLAIVASAHARPSKLVFESRLFPVPKFEYQLKAPEPALKFVLPKIQCHVVLGPDSPGFFADFPAQFAVPDPRDAIRQLGGLGQKASSVEMFVLDPHTIFDNEKLKTLQDFVVDRWWIRERATTDNKNDIWSLSYFLILSVANNGLDGTADCFVPSYALRYSVDGKTIDVLVAFDCWAIRISDGKNVIDYPIDEHLEKYFRTIFAEHGLLNDGLPETFVTASSSPRS